MRTYQQRVLDWITTCFGFEVAVDKVERGHRLLEEALEAVQAGHCTKEEAHQLVDYVYGRPKGEVFQEVGGIMNTLAAFCLAYEVDMNLAAEVELVRCWQNLEKIRGKHAAKPKFGPLP